MSKLKRSHKKLDPDIKTVFGTYRALKGSSSPRMLRANLEFVAGHFGYEIVEIPPPEPCGCKYQATRFHMICEEHSLQNYMARFRMPPLDGD